MCRSQAAPTTLRLQHCTCDAEGKVFCPGGVLDMGGCISTFMVTFYCACGAAPVTLRLRRCACEAAPATLCQRRYSCDAAPMTLSDNAAFFAMLRLRC